MTGERRVVVTGLGAVTPSGLDVPSAWDAISRGRSAVARLDGPEYDGQRVRIGARVGGFDASRVADPREARRLSRVLLWALAAADEALAHAGAAGGEPVRDPDHVASPWDPGRVDVIAATGSGPVDVMQDATRAHDARGPRAVPAALALYGSPDAAATLVARRHGWEGATLGVSAACASGAIGIGDGLRRIRHGYADAVLVVGMDDLLGPVNLAANANIGALASATGDPAAASRPFDRGRTGYVMAQGAAAVLLESSDGAQDRGARAIAEVAGFGASNDAHHAASPHPDGAGAARAIRACLVDAGVRPDDVDHVNAHATGTPIGDAAELAALDAALGARVRRIPVTATKSSTGHLLGASGVLDAIVSVLTIDGGVIPPTRNLDDPEPGWDFVASPRRTTVGAVLSTSFGFGGHNAALVLRASRR
ncbi:beta-ketoacyl-[acyl-carrier-protein] synthase family protein [Microbacterium karelineae]|uniref:beta-ketoacyl-[acyl-carrier-protein] synthase family protein n=1 Tax=Microbacterium karelineae TaxID=2654283 RepID=UPI001E53DD03|nr:beta-ketoacyl-[acyl-carrier-protein] synthase family protein [Microbacterium karelineae]